MDEAAPRFLVPEVMNNRIRYYRHRAGLTLQQLAAMVGTTPQTVSRLETEVMSVSTDWLKRFASALGVLPADLVEGGGARPPAYLGKADATGDILAAREGQAEFSLPLPGGDAVAVTLSAPLGRFGAGDILIGQRRGDIALALDRDCIVGLADGRTLIARLVPAGRDHVTLVPLASGQSALHRQRLRWAAPISLRIEPLGNPVSFTDSVKS